MILTKGTMSIVRWCSIWQSWRNEELASRQLIEVGHFELIDPRSSAWPVVKEAVLKLGEGELDDNDSAIVLGKCLSMSCQSRFHNRSIQPSRLAQSKLREISELSEDTLVSRSVVGAGMGVIC